MAGARYVVEPFGPHHDRTAFSCGEEPLDLYFKQRARQDVDRSLAAVFVLLDTDTNRVAGYYTLSALSVELTDFPPDIARKLPRYPIPTTLIGRLAVDVTYQKQRLGKALLFNALRRAYRQRTEVGATAVVVDAKHDRARAFYERYEFRRFPEREYRLFLMMKTIGQLVGDDG
ncbi:MAG: GNAT family N-acetyltransferase [Thermomicrobiales bacterium]